MTEARSVSCCAVEFDRVFSIPTVIPQSAPGTACSTGKSDPEIPVYKDPDSRDPVAHSRAPSISDTRPAEDGLATPTASSFGLSEMQLQGYLADADRAAAKQQEEERRERMYQYMNALLGVFLYLGAGVLFYSLQEEWGFVDALYFTIVTVTTTGYGDLVPTSNASKWFTTFYILSGISLLGIALGIAGASVVTEATDNAEKADTGWQDLTFSMPSPRRLGKQLKAHATEEKPKLTFVHNLLETIRKIGMCLLPLIGYIGLGTIFFTQFDQEYSFTNAVYMSSITLSTVGYGDMVPHSEGGRIFACFWIFSGVLLVGWSLQSIGDMYLRGQLKKDQRRKLAIELTIRDLVAHGGEDGKLDVHEFALAKLMAQGKITRGDVEQCNRQFTEMDADNSGYLDTEDILGGHTADHINNDVPELDSDVNTHI